MQISTYLSQLTGLTPQVLLGTPGSLTPPLVAVSADAAGLHTITLWAVPNVTQPTPEALAAALAAPEPPPSVTKLATRLVEAAAAACATISAQVIPDQVHRDAYTNAATIVWANAGAAPTTDPAKTLFAQQAAAAGITDPAAFAKVVTTVSLASMRLSTILGTLQGAAAVAKTPSDLSAALTAFAKALGDFVASLNAAGLTVTIDAPAPIVIAGLAA